MRGGLAVKITKRVFNMEMWRAVFAGPLKVKVVIERPDGTELYHFYPVDRDVDRPEGAP